MSPALNPPSDEGGHHHLPELRSSTTATHWLKRLLTSAATPRGKTIGIGLLLAVALTGELRLSGLDISRHINEHGISVTDFYADYRMEIIDQQATQRKIDRTQQSLAPIYQDEQPHDQDISEDLDKLLIGIANSATNDVLSRDERRRRFLNLLDRKAHAETIFDRFLDRPISEKTWGQISQAVRTTMERILSDGFTEADEQLKRPAVIRQSLSHTGYPAEYRDFVFFLVDARLQPNRIVDEAAMHRKQDAVATRITREPETRLFTKGEKIVGKGEFVTPVQMAALEKMGKTGGRTGWLPLLGSIMLAGLFVMSLWSAIRYFRNGRFFRPPFAALIATLVLLGFAMLQLQQQGLFGHLPAFALPLAALSLTLAVFTHPTISVVATALLIFFAALTLRTDFQSLAVLLCGSCVGIYVLGKRIDQGSRGQLMVAGFYVGAANASLLLALNLMKPDLGSEQHLSHLQLSFANMQMLLSSIFGGIFSGILTIGSLPLLEAFFRLVTPYTLVELGNHDQPLLKRMQFEAPGTFHHSLMVATLAEAASQAIGGNALLTRVGCLYHDIGKMKRPLFFIENQAYFGVENPHDKLTPRLSKMVITAHPRDSLDMARQNKLPECLMPFMTEHHGTLTAGYFYNKACQEEGVENVNKSQFRYPGPKPGSRETAIVMLADACESAVRALKNPTVAQVEERIDKIIRQRIDESQFDLCPITMKDLNIIKQTFVRILRGIQHSRIEYQQNMMLELGRKMPVVTPEAGTTIHTTIQPSPIAANGTSAPVTETGTAIDGCC
jgi:cyclic-di-AMP phosphodiesterase PgpH